MMVMLLVWYVFLAQFLLSFLVFLVSWMVSVCFEFLGVCNFVDLIESFFFSLEYSLQYNFLNNCWAHCFLRNNSAIFFHLSLSFIILLWFLGPLFYLRFLFFFFFFFFFFWVCIICWILNHEVLLILFLMISLWCPGKPQESRPMCFNLYIHFSAVYLIFFLHFTSLIIWSLFYCLIFYFWAFLYFSEKKHVFSTLTLFSFFLSLPQ